MAAGSRPPNGAPQHAWEDPEVSRAETLRGLDRPRSPLQHHEHEWPLEQTSHFPSQPPPHVMSSSVPPQPPRRQAQMQGQMQLSAGGGARPAPRITKPEAGIAGQGGSQGGEPPRRRCLSTTELVYPSPAMGAVSHAPLPANLAADWHEWRETEAYVEWQEEAEDQVDHSHGRIGERMHERAQAVRGGRGRGR